jgi:hypothetical protein
METKVVELEVKTKGAVKSIDNVNDALEKTNKESKKLSLIGKGLATAKKGAKGFGAGLKTIASGVGVFTIIALALDKLKELFQSNQKVVDTFNIAFEALSIAFNDFFNFISKNVGAVSGFFKKIFDDPLASVKALGNAIKDNIIERVKSALEVFGFLGKAMKKLFAGDFKGAIDEVKNAGSEFVDVLTGVDNSVEKASEVISEGVTALTEYTKSTVEAATANVELKKQAELAAVANQGLIEKYDLQAESLRQIRDDERLSIEERKKANDELLLVLDQQEKAMLSNAQISLRAAQAELKKDKNNIEFKKAVMEAENELAAVRAQVAGFRSEQQANDLALSKEELEMSKSKLESENNLSIERKRFNAEQIKDEKERLLALQRIDAEEAEVGRERLTNEIALYKEGTQAKVDAEIALAEFEEQIYQQKVNRSNELTALETDNNEKQKKSDEDKTQAKIDNQNAILSATTSALGSIGQIADAFAGDDEERAKKAFNINKGLGIAQAIISTSQGIMNAYTNPVDVASGVAFAKSIAIGLAGAAQIATIATTEFQPSGGGSSSPSTSTNQDLTSTSQSPSFNVVGQSGFNQVAGALGQQQPVQAYVVAGNVTTAQQLQNNTIQQATF